MVERRVQMTGQVLGLRGGEQALGAHIASDVRRAACSSAWAAAAYAPCSRARVATPTSPSATMSSGPVLARARCQILLLTPRDRVGQCRVGEPPLRGQGRVGNGGARQLVAEQHARRALLDDPCPLGGLEYRRVEVERRTCARDGRVVAALGERRQQ